MIINNRGFFEETTTNVITAQAEESSLAQAQRDIYDSHRHRVFSLAYHMTGNELAAEQLLTSSFIAAFSVAPKPDGLVIDQALIAQLRHYFSFTSAAPAVMDTATVPVSGKNVRRTDLEEAIQELPSTERLLFLLRDVEGYRSEMISQLLEMPQPQVNRALFSARIRLRGILARLEASRAA